MKLYVHQAMSYVSKEHFVFRFIYGFCDLTCFQENLKTETLLKQFEIVKEETNTSHVQEFGDLACISQTRQPFCFCKNYYKQVSLLEIDLKFI